MSKERYTQRSWKSSRQQNLSLVWVCQAAQKPFHVHKVLQNNFLGSMLLSSQILYLYLSLIIIRHATQKESCQHVCIFFPQNYSLFMQQRGMGGHLCSSAGGCLKGPLEMAGAVSPITDVQTRPSSMCHISPLVGHLIRKFFVLNCPWADCCFIEFAIQSPLPNTSSRWNSVCKSDDLHRRFVFHVPNHWTPAVRCFTMSKKLPNSKSEFISC